MLQNRTADKLLGTTTLIESVGSTGSCFGTGFVYEARVAGGFKRTFLVTNRHQLQAAAGHLRMCFLKSDPQGLPRWGEAHEVIIDGSAPRWFAHPRGLDVAVMPLASLAPRVGSLLAVSADVALTREQERLTCGVERVLTVGYPNGLRDPVNYAPIAREGITATPISLDYEGEPTFCIDAATFRGSSGSPVFLLGAEAGNESPYSILGRQVRLAGLVTDLHAYRAVGDVRQVPASVALELGVLDPMHLGLVLKARAIDECVDFALESVGFRRASAPAVALEDRRAANE